MAKTKMQETLKKIPKNPGIYQYFDKNGKIIYIGKSINLFNRVNSYFNGKSKLNFAKQKMVEQIAKIETILTNNETESLILETTLIKKYQPKYNILMKDDKNHIYIKITSEVIPKIIKTRIKGKIGEYFGPYTSTNYVNNILKIVKKVFGYRSCNIIFEIGGKEQFKTVTYGEYDFQIKSSSGIKIPCIDYYIKRCSGPCLLEISKINQYSKNIENIKKFLKGDFKEIVKNLEFKMLNLAKNLKFEEAEKLKKDIESIKSLENHQIVRDFVIGNYEVINYLEKFDKIFIGLTIIRDSKITGYHNFEIENNLEEVKEEIMNIFIERRILEINEENNIKLKDITFLLPFEIQNTPLIPENTLNSPLSGEDGEGFEVPKIGPKLELLNLTYKNLYEFATKNHLNSLSTKSFTKQTMKNLLDLLGYKQINKNLIFECNDISHFSGNYTVASRSVIENGKTQNSKYKKFKIKTLTEGKIDDFSSMKEIMQRRLKELIKLGNIPDLIIIDGGKGQLSSVMKIIEEMKVFNSIDIFNNIQLVSIAKREEELFLPGEKKSIILGKDSLELRLVQKIRDEAHRFAITFNRDSRIKAMKKNILESLPGFGAKTRKKLLTKYGNIENLRNIKREELSLILNKNQIETLENHGIIE